MPRIETSPKEIVSPGDIIIIMANNENNLKDLLSNGITFNFTFKDNFDNKYMQTVTGSGIFNDRIKITEPNLVNE